MSSLPLNVYSVATVRAIDRTAIEDQGIAGYTLMTRAGAAAVTAAKERFAAARRWQVVCGAGNNAGDGYVVARLAARDGIVVSVVTLVDPTTLKGDAATAYQDYVAAGGTVVPWAGELDSGAQLLIDGMLGSGLEREVGGRFADAVEAINAHPAGVLALDIPTGIHGDTGAVLGAAVRADLTVTFVGLKTGLYLDDAPDFCGELVFAGLDIPDGCLADKPPVMCRIDESTLSSLLPRRSRAAHKGDFGHVLVIGGGEGMPGAARLCAEAALRSGAGRVSIATHPSHAAQLIASRPELMSQGIASPGDLDPLLAKADVLAFGPGLGGTDWARGIFDRVAGDSRPAVWDADALQWLAQCPNRSAARVLTPHPGEAGVLLETSAGRVQADRLGTLQALSERYGGTAVLKGSGSLIGTAGELPALCTAGNPGMATAGMGDVLTGVLAGMLAQGLPPFEAARAAVFGHACAGDIAARCGERGLIASDVIDVLRDVFNP